MDRFAEKVVVADSGCWLWTGATAGAGYGVIGSGRTASGNARTEYAHRVSYEHFVGAIPQGLEIDHKCRMKLCVNPAHLEPVTHAENRRRARQTHCERGHVMPTEGRRQCKRCDADRAKAYRARRRVSA